MLIAHPAADSSRSFWGIGVKIDSLLSSISAFSTDLKRIQTPHRLFLDLRADKTLFWSTWSQALNQDSLVHQRDFSQLLSKKPGHCFSFGYCQTFVGNRDPRWGFSNGIVHCNQVLNGWWWFSGSDSMTDCPKTLSIKKLA